MNSGHDVKVSDCNEFCDADNKGEPTEEANNSTLELPIDLGMQSH